MIVRLAQACVCFPLVADVVDALEEILDVDRVLMIFGRIESWIFGISCEVAGFGVLDATLDDARVLCVNVEALSWLDFVLGDDDGWHFCGEAAFVLALGDRCVLVASDEHIGSVEVATQRRSVCLSFKGLQVLLAVIVLLLASAVLQSLFCLHRLYLLFSIASSLITKSDGLSRQHHNITAHLILSFSSLRLVVIRALQHLLRISHRCLPLDIPTLLMLGRRLRYQT